MPGVQDSHGNARAGLRPTDTILSIGEQATLDASDLQRAMGTGVIDVTISMRVLRDDDVVTIDVVPTELS